MGCGSGAAVDSDAGKDAGPPPFQTREVDLLFMVDDTGSMRPAQTMLGQAFPALLDQLRQASGEKPPSLHMAVVSSNLGAGPGDALPACPVGGDQGAFQVRPSQLCPTSELKGGDTFVSWDGDQRNFDGDLNHVFGCLSALGDLGCAFEHPFASVLKALEPGAQPPGNAGFLRKDALLVIVLLTNEDDCSAPPDSSLFDTSSSLVSDPLGPLASFRCNEFGHLCNGQPPPRTPTREETPLSCVSTEDGVLLRVADVASRLRALKDLPDQQIVLAAIAAPPAPYNVGVGSRTTSAGVTEDQPEIRNSCQSLTGWGNPGVRVAQLLNSFGAGGHLQSICDDSYRPTMQWVGEQIVKRLRP
jgi:hypothetical protein